MKKLIRVPVLLVIFFALHASSMAASFDCTKTASPREHLICGDPILSDLDSQLGTRYKERQELLGSRGAASAQRSQKSWLRFVSVVCPLDSTSDNPSNCLQREYRSRLEELSGVGQKLGPFTFKRIDLFTADHSSDTTDESGSWHGFITKHVGYPQIDHPDTSTTRFLNKLFAKTLSDSSTNYCESDGDGDVDYRVTFASEKLVSVTWSNYIYCHGAAHGMGGTETENIILQPVPHKLETADLFGSGSDWVPKLQALFWDGLQKQGWTAEFGSAKEGILEIVVDPEEMAIYERWN